MVVSKIWIKFFESIFPLTEAYIHLKTCYLVGKILMDALSWYLSLVLFLSPLKLVSFLGC